MARNNEQGRKNDKLQSAIGRKDINTDVSSRKRNLTLDFAFSGLHKRSKLDLSKDALLSSPDMKKLNLKTPELENMILSQNPIAGPTPTPTTHNQILFPRVITEAQADYAKGFEDALNELHCSDSSQEVSFGVDVNSNSSSNITYTDLDPSSRPSTYLAASPLELVIKDEPQTVPSMGDSPHLSPIDMECQEVIKLERKRQRNRVAASKCRKRKLERISRLEDKVKALKGENNELNNFLMKLKNQVSVLKSQVLDHVNSGCQMVNYF